MKSNLSPEQIKKINSIPTESVDQYLARGGEIHYVGSGVGKRSPAKTVDAQQLLNLASGSQYEAAVIKFLESQGFDVQ